jgi:hypothetical protein
MVWIRNLTGRSEKKHEHFSENNLCFGRDPNPILSVQGCDTIEFGRKVPTFGGTYPFNLQVIRITLLPWGWRQEIPSKVWHLSTIVRCNIPEDSALHTFTSIYAFFMYFMSCNSKNTRFAINIIWLRYLWGYVISPVGNRVGKKSRQFNEISCMAI